MSALRVLGLGLVLGTLLTPVAMADGRNPGSALVFTVQRSGPNFFTIISVTNTNTLPDGPATFGGSTELHYEYVNSLKNGANVFEPCGCDVFNRVEFLTPADTLSVVTACHNAVLPQGQEGYLVVSARDPALFEVPWRFDYLMGSELVINASSGMYSINAIPFRAGKGIEEYSPTDVSSPFGQLNFDGIEYEGTPDVLYVDSFVALQTSQLALINLTGGPQSINTAQLTVWNDNEFALSSTRTFRCWFDQPLNLVSPLFEETYLANATPDDPDELKLNCDDLGGDIETGWARIDSIGVETSGGLPVTGDGAMLGSITAGPHTQMDGGRLLWESRLIQTNGVAFNVGGGSTVNCGPGNLPPLCQLTSNPPSTIEVGEELCVTYTFTDPDDAQVFVQNTGPAGAVFDPPDGFIAVPYDGMVCWTPTENDVGPHDFMIMIEDSFGQKSTCSFSVTVEDIECSEEVTIDFNELFGGQKLAPLTEVTNQYEAMYDFTVSAQSDSNMAVIFDSSNPPPRDADLGTPNGMIDGGPGLVNGAPGIGFGPGAGTNNTVPMGNLLILQNDGTPAQPNDDPNGGLIIITFNGPPVALKDFKIVDAEENPLGTVRAFDQTVGGTMLLEEDIPGLGCNSVETVTSDQFDLLNFATRRVEIEFFGSGALGEFTLCFE